MPTVVGDRRDGLLYAWTGTACVPHCAGRYKAASRHEGSGAIVRL
jgi:hypothetical protein